MTIIDAPRHQLIRKLLGRRPDAIPEVSVVLWEQLSAQLITIIGVGGFDSLLTRSLHLAGAQFPWLMTIDNTSLAARLAELKDGLAARDADAAGTASMTLMIHFVDILVMLIGEKLTDNILQSAWGDGDSDKAVKDSDHE